MIKNFKHKGLKVLFQHGARKGIPPEHALKILRMLDRLNSSISALDMDLPGYDLHQLVGNKEGKWAVKLTGNVRIVFEFVEENAYDVDLIDYH